MLNQLDGLHKAHALTVARRRLVRSLTRHAYLVDAGAPDIVIRTEHRLLCRLFSELQQVTAHRENANTGADPRFRRAASSRVTPAQTVEVA